jgi:hypothetical protein
MPKETKLRLTEKHHTSLVDIIDQVNTVVVFGKIVKDLQPTSRGHGFAQVFGYKRGNVCSKLPSTVVMALPDPDGPADDCGWDPQEFVKWSLPSSFLTTQLHIQSLTLASALAANPPSALTGAQISAIVSTSLQAVTGSTQPLDPSQSLQAFGVLSSQLVGQLSAVIAAKVSQYGFSLNPNALAAMSPGWTIAQLESAIHDGAQPNG